MLTSCLYLVEPSLAPHERKLIEIYGGWTQFMITMGLKPNDPESIGQAHQVIQKMAAAHKGHLEAMREDGAPEKRGGSSSQRDKNKMSSGSDINIASSSS